MKRSNSKLSLTNKKNDDQQNILNYFAKPASKLFTAVSDQCTTLTKTKDGKKTPEKLTQKLDQNIVPTSQELLRSPDLLPPTPPQPKRMKLDRNFMQLANKEKSRDLQPKALLNQINKVEVISVDQKLEKTQIYGAPTEKDKLQDKNSSDYGESTTKLLEKGHGGPKNKKEKRDFYNLGRHKVIETELAENRRELRLVVAAEGANSSMKRICMLRDMWLNTAVKVGDIVHIHSTWHELVDEDDELTEVAIIDCKSGLIVVHPDLLISGTSVVSSLFCPRKAVLSERFRSTEPTNQIMLNGTLIHRLLQTVLTDRNSDAQSLAKILDSLLCDSSTLHNLYGAKLLKEDLKSEAMKFIPMINYFLDKFIHGKSCQPPCNNQSQPIHSKKSFAKPVSMWSGKIETVCDIEENIWSPWLGIKGKVDFTVKVNEEKLEHTKIPMELKTGRSSFSAEHKGQLTLYSMMMSHNKKGSDCEASPGGLLLYLKDGAIQHVPAGIQEKQALIQLRNEMVHYLTAPTTKSTDGSINEAILPPPIDRIQACAKCPFVTECTIYQTAENSSNADTIKAALPMERISHLSSAHQQYFLQWSRMLRIEWEESSFRSRSISDIWCLDPLDREAQGRCFSHLQVNSCQASQFSTSEFDQYSITLTASGERSLPAHVSLQIGDSVVLSTDTEIAVATGCLIDINSRSITISTDRNLNNWDRDYKALHMDKLEYQGGQSLLYSNLSRLMANTERSAKLRELIIDQRPPKFKTGLPRSVLEVGKSILKKLNKLQQRAVLKALTTEDYCLINGLPGTGKTSLIVALIRLAVLLGQTILLTSYTHSAVDNVLLKLVQFEDVDFIRIGREHRTHPSILPYSAEVKGQNCQTIEDLERMYNVPVIAATCLSVGHPALMRRQFDLCIVDEAAQALQLAVIGPLTAAKKFVLVGDPLQLPPVVQSKTAKALGMDESLFVRLSNVTPDAIVPLQLQYRMCGPVNSLANKLTYGGDLKCGNESVEQATLHLPLFDETSPELSHQRWLLAVIKPGLIGAVSFLDTNLLSTRFHRSLTEDGTKAPVNPCEAALTLLLAAALNKNGLSYDNVGIIAPYQSQVQYLRNFSKNHPNLEINTVDQYQGRDKDAILYTCTKSESAETFQDQGNQTILHDLRRLTVAVTRAKHKLIIVGDSVTLKRYPPFVKLLNALEEHQWIRLCFGKDGLDSKQTVPQSLL